MIFSELYSVYYNTVAKILGAVLTEDISEREIHRQITENAFSESVLTILPALKNGKWPLLNRSLETPICHTPTMPLTMLEKQWLKAIFCDPRMRLFGACPDKLADIQPLFCAEDINVFDKYGDGDPFEDEGYITRFRLLLEAIRTNRPVTVKLTNRYGRETQVRFFPKGLEYSEKDDKFRVIAEGCRFSQFNLGRLTSCEYYNGNGAWKEHPKENQVREVVLQIEDERNALERVMLHFAHFEKQAERVDATHYTVRIRYYEYDETEIVIRVLSFGPYVRVTEPNSFICLIQERLAAQKSCKLK